MKKRSLLRAFTLCLLFLLFENTQSGSGRPSGRIFGESTSVQPMQRLPFGVRTLE